LPGQVRGHVVDRWGEWGSDQVGRKVVAKWAGQAVGLCEDAEGVFIKKAKRAAMSCTGGQEPGGVRVRPVGSEDAT
jgi:hypothetical protein